MILPPSMRQGFTLVEILLVVAVLVLLIALSVPALRAFQRGSTLQNTTEEAVVALQLARSRAVASLYEDRWGVHFNDTATPHQYVLFQGSSYASRVVAQDQIFPLSADVQIDSVSLDGGGNDVVFDRVDGATPHFGTVTFSLVSDPAETQTISVEASGKIEISAGATPSDSTRVTDTRHMHVAYEGRAIDTATETMTLTFSSPPDPDVTHDIVIADFLVGGQIEWEGTVDVYGEEQTLTVATHQLNAGFSSDETQFTLRRDRRWNTKTLLVTISGDTSGTPAGRIIEYDAAGTLVTGGESIYVVSTTTQ